MNKYQEALLKLGEYTVVLSWSKNQTCSINELNEFKLLQELVDKATPKKPIISSYDEFGYVDFYEHHYCPNCKNKVDKAYCPACGQKIDWSLENE